MTMTTLHPVQFAGYAAKHERQLSTSWRKAEAEDTTDYDFYPAGTWEHAPKHAKANR